MRSFFGFAVIVVCFICCDEQRVFEKNTDFDSRYWLVNDTAEFEFDIRDSLESYNLYCNVRNSLDYPYARIFVTYYLKDSTGVVMEKDLIGKLLFDDKTGEPFGESGLGDLYDHRLLLKQGYRFPHPGKYRVSFEQYMRTDTLAGVLAVGLRVEKNATVD